MSDLVGNPEDRFSHNEVHIFLSPCSITPTYTFDIVLLLHSKDSKKCPKCFNRLTNRKLKPKNDLEQVFCMCKGGNPKVFNLKF